MSKNCCDSNIFHKWHKTTDEKILDLIVDAEKTAIEVLKGKDYTKIFQEFLIGYEDNKRYTDYSLQDDNYVQLKNSEKMFIAMDKPVPPSYKVFDKSKWAYQKIEIEVKSLDNSNSTSTHLPVEYRGITLKQLRAVKKNIIRRCIAENWKGGMKRDVPLTPETVSLYDVNTYIILPFTYETRGDFVSSLPSTGCLHCPRWFVSHWWGESVFEFVACIEQFVYDFRANYNDDDDRRGGGMTEDTPFWICVYANNQWDLSNYVTNDPGDSGFAKAMETVKYRTLSLLDKNGIVFTRIWCIFELYMTMLRAQDLKKKISKQGQKSEGGVWAVYAAQKHLYQQYSGYDPEERKAVGIITGGATGDAGSSDWSKNREQHFPFDLIMKSLKIKVETASATVDTDRVNILNYIVGRTLDLSTNPPEQHKRYTDLNKAVCAAFASPKGTLGRAMNESDEDFKKVLTAMSHGRRDKHIELYLNNFDGLTAQKAAALVRNLPCNLESVELWYAPFHGTVFMEAVIEWISESTNLKRLLIFMVHVTGDTEGRDVGKKFAQVVANNSTIEKLSLQTDVVGSRNASHWADALAKNKTLKVLEVFGMGDYSKNEPKYASCDGYYVDGMLLNKGFEDLALGIAANKALEIVKLTHHGVGSDGIAALSPALNANKTIKNIEIWADPEKKEEALIATNELSKMIPPRVEVSCI